MAEAVNAILRLATRSPSEDSLATMHLSLLDWMAVGVAGCEEPAPLAVRKLLNSEGGLGAATIFGGGRAPTRSAALFNGTASHALDYDDTHFAHIGHLAVGILPGTLAMAESRNASIKELVLASVKGCEAAIRMGLYLGRSHYQIGFHQTATAGAFGATVAGAAIAELTVEQFHNALGLVATRASGLKSQFGTDGKPLNAGLAASNGVEAVELARNGMISNPDGWDGPGGFAETHHAQMIGGFENEELLPQIMHKFHACCHGLHATLEALREHDPPAVSAVKKIIVRTHPRWIAVCNNPNPKTGLELKFSFSGVIGLWILGHDTAALSAFSDQNAMDQTIVEVTKLVTVEADPTLSEVQSIVRIETKGGAFEASADLARVGDVSQRTAKVRQKAATLLGDTRAERIWGVLNGNPDEPVSTLTALMS